MSTVHQEKTPQHRDLNAVDALTAVAIARELMKFSRVAPEAAWVLGLGIGVDLRPAPR